VTVSWHDSFTLLNDQLRSAPWFKLQFDHVRGVDCSINKITLTSLLCLITDGRPRGIFHRLVLGSFSVPNIPNAGLSINIRLITSVKHPTDDCVQDNCGCVQACFIITFVRKFLDQWYLNDDKDWHIALYAVICILAIVVARKLATTRIVIAAAITFKCLIDIETVMTSNHKISTNFVGRPTPKGSMPSKSAPNLLNNEIVYLSDFSCHPIVGIQKASECDPR